MKCSIYLLSVALCVAASQGRHIHPKLGDRLQVEEFEEISTQRIVENESALPDRTKIKVTWFVPLNDKFFFLPDASCEPGYRRDVSGVCREVWD